MHATIPAVSRLMNDYCETRLRFCRPPEMPICRAFSRRGACQLVLS